jgi:tetrapyrrole methylase family protein/MazG family protein
METMNRLTGIIETLRAPDGCPWDREQDHKSIMKCLIEETYELADAIEGDDAQTLKEELGDVLLQVVFHSAIAKDEGQFTLDDVINTLCDKLIYRHPHVFGDASVRNSEEVIKNWESLKRREEGKKERESILSGIPATLPALLAALKIQSATSRVGFDWDSPAGVFDKITEEMDEVRDAMDAGDPVQIEDEIGDLIFSAVNLARLLKIDPEAALRRTNKKFTRRFHEIEKAAQAQNIPLADMPMAEKERLWQQAKDPV